MHPIDKILNEYTKNHTDKNRNDEITAEFRSKLKSFQQVVIYGAGVVTAPAILKLLKVVNITPLAFTDSDSNKWDKSLEGIPIYSIEKIKTIYDNSKTLIIIAVRGDYSSFISINNILKEKQFFNVMQCSEWLRYREILKLADYNMMSTQATNLIIQNKDKLKYIYQLLNDKQSKEEFLDIIKKRLLPYECEFSYHNATYFPTDMFANSMFYSIVDCGAYRGDTLEEFLKLKFTFHNYYMLEMDSHNLQKLNDKVNSYNADIKEKCTIFPYAVASYNGYIKIHEDNSVGSYVDTKEGSTEVKCKTIDDLLGNSEITLIKMDIEGAEYDALLGAKNVIKKQRPVLVISLYHKDDDLWEIPELLRSMVDNYQGILRTEGLFEYLYYYIPYEKMIREDKYEIRSNMLQTTYKTK